MVSIFCFQGWWQREEEKPNWLSCKMLFCSHGIQLGFSLILSKTIKLDIDLSSVHVEVIDDIPCVDDNGNIVCGDNGDPMIHTDGTGFISEDLAMKCPQHIYRGKCSIPTDIQKFLGGAEALERRLGDRSLTSEVPLLIQFRMFNNGKAVKGTLLLNKLLPPETIQVRPSMIKVESDPSISYIQSCNSLEIVATSNQPKRTCLSRHLIVLLHYGGVPKEFFLELLMNSLDDAQNARYSKQAALRVALKYGDMDDFLVSRMILCGIPLDEPYLQFRLSILMREERKSLKTGKLPVTDCYYLMGTVDPTGLLKPNEVCVILENGQVSGDVLVYKHPGLHFGDIHVLTATYNKDLEKFVGYSKYAIFFPTKGPRSLADEMANSDFDGDMYWVSRNSQLLQYFRSSLPWTPTPSSMRGPRGIQQKEPIEFSSKELERELFQQFLINRFKPSNTVSMASDCWLSYMDRLLTLGDECAEEKECLKEKILQLVNIYYDALDAPKSGLKVEVPIELKAEKYPHYMERSNSYTSTSILGLIFDTVNSVQTEDPPSNGISKLPCFAEESSQSCLLLWSQRYSNYLKEMKQVMEMKHETKDSKNEMADEIIQKYKLLLYGAAEFEESPRKLEDIWDEARAIYNIAYGHTERCQAVGRCSFAWNVAGRALCMLHASRQGEKCSIPCSTTVLKEILG
ncbi:RNA-dependent RNA polymerase [Musa troglodytarum]|uniref:RNA-dependent RNA polymerase n=1 Tax=Musa troglodytarum TaxID=320322 RepID=A0A9E7L5N1_9LILI|nr:RNA-dependent RNA polymerase [Musa troglodytarum]